MSNAVFLLLGGNNSYVQFLRPLGDVIHIPDTPKEDQLYLVKDVDAVVFTGGSDVNPKLYGEVSHPRTSFITARDEIESKFYKEAVRTGIPVIGICRGAQFLTVMNNGKLYQHVTGHTSGSHLLEVIDPITGKQIVMTCSSTHHQMMNPFMLPKDEYILCGWSKGRESKTYETCPDGLVVLNKAPKLEPELVYFPYTDSLCIQGHPEFDMKNIAAYSGMMKKYINLLVNQRLKRDVLTSGKAEQLDRTKLHNVSIYANVNVT